MGSLKGSENLGTLEEGKAGTWTEKRATSAIEHMAHVSTFLKTTNLFFCISLSLSLSLSLYNSFTKPIRQSKRTLHTMEIEVKMEILTLSFCFSLYIYICICFSLNLFFCISLSLSLYNSFTKPIRQSKRTLHTMEIEVKMEILTLSFCFSLYIYICICFSLLKNKSCFIFSWPKRSAVLGI